MFSVWELAVIGGVALLVYGPEQLPDIAKNVGRQIKKMRQFTNELSKAIETPSLDEQLKENEERAKQADEAYHSKNS